MFKRILERLRKKRPLTKEDNIYVVMKNGEVVPLIADPDRLELVKHPLGEFEIRVKESPEEDK